MKKGILGHWQNTLVKGEMKNTSTSDDAGVSRTGRTKKIQSSILPYFVLG